MLSATQQIGRVGFYVASVRPWHWKRRHLGPCVHPKAFPVEVPMRF